MEGRRSRNGGLRDDWRAGSDGHGGVYSADDLERAGHRADADFGGGLFVADLRARLVPGGAEAIGGDPGVVCGFGAFLVDVRAGGVLAEPLRAAQHQPQRAGIRVSSELVSIRSGVFRGAAGAGLRVAVVEARTPGAI